MEYRFFAWRVAVGHCALVFATSCAELDHDRAAPEPAAEPELLVESEIVTQPSFTPGQMFPVGGPTYFEFTGTAQCREGAAAGVTVKRVAGAKKVMIYFKGGGSCFDPFSCAMSDTFLSPTKIDEGMKSMPTQGIFELGHAGNPIAGWNIVYVPYCTGDMHLGTKIGNVPGGPQNQRFFGRKNLDQYLKSIVTTFSDATHVLVAGESSGGAGAGGSALAIRNAFRAVGKNPIIRLLDDSGPFLSAGSTPATDYFPQCAQDRWRTTWGLEDSVLKDCGAACRDAAGNLLPNFVPAFANYVTSQFTNAGAKPAFLVSYHDVGLGIVFGNAKNLCVFGGNINYSMENALSDLRNRYATTLSSYYVDNWQHTYLPQSYYWSTTQNGVSLNSWVTSFLDGAPIANPVGP